MGWGDVRITTRLLDHDFTSGLSATIHETGHGLYDQGLPPELDDNFAGQVLSLGLHESQSRLWENHVGRSLPFWESEMPRLRSLYPVLAGLDAPTLVAAVNRVSRSLIRIEADEVTYPLHIAVRFEIELALMRGSLEVGDLPAAFNQAMERHVGITPTDDRDGVLQDVHWSVGLIGYFPTYALGSVYAAAFFAAAQHDLGGAEALAAAVGAGDHSGLLGWLRRNVHARASLVPVREIVHDATGMPIEGPIDTTPFLAHLRARYL
jgi:carboxypeptidase Taq